MMGKKVLLATCIILLSCSKLDKEPQSIKILQANLSSAVSLESKLIAICGNVNYQFQSYTDSLFAPLFNNLGNYYFQDISLKNPRANQYFQQGLRPTFAFNHTEAHRSFKKVTELDSSSAMGY